MEKLNEVFETFIDLLVLGGAMLFWAVIALIVVATPVLLGLIVLIVLPRHMTAKVRRKIGQTLFVKE